MEQKLNDLLLAPWKTAVVFAAVQLNLFTRMKNKPGTALEMASLIKADEKWIKAILNVCVGMRLLEYKNGKYKNTPFSQRYLCAGEPRYMGDLIKLQHQEFNRWYTLGETILGKNGSPPAREDKHRTFMLGMQNLGKLGEASALLEEVELTGCRTMLDAGGGTGLYSIVFCEKYPRLNARIMDKKESLMVAKEMVSLSRVSGRISFQEGNITRDSLGEGLDAILMSDVIYHTSSIFPVLQNARNSLTAGGLLIIRGYYQESMEPDPARLFETIFSLNVMTHDGDREVITLSSLKEYLGQAGFEILHSGQLTRRSVFLVAKKTG